MKLNVQVEIELKLNDQVVEDILCTALEGYMMSCWAIVDNTTDDWKKAKKELKDNNQEAYFSTICAKVMENGDNILIEDAEGEGYESIYHEEGTSLNPWVLNKERFIKGIQLYTKHRGNVVDKVENGDFDDVEADCLIQYSVFGDVIFG